MATGLLKRSAAFIVCILMLLQLFACVPEERQTASEGPAAASAEPSAAASAEPSEEPAEEPSGEPSEEPSHEPAETPAQTEEPSEEPTPAPTSTPKPTNTPKPTADPRYPYMLYVEKGSFTLTIYGIGSDKQYSKVVKRYRISHGGNRTPTGNFVLSRRERWHPFSGGDNGYAQYAVMYNPKSDPTGWTGLFIHGPMYRSQDPNDLWPRYYDGEKAIGGENTQGCLRMVVEAAKFIYDNCPKGTPLKIVNGSPRNTKSKDVPPRNGLKHDPTDKEAADRP